MTNTLLSVQNKPGTEINNETKTPILIKHIFKRLRL